MSPRRSRARRTTSVALVACTAVVATLLVSVPAAVAADPTFSDVPESHPFFDEIEWMVAEGITTGYSDATFRPTVAITRGSMSAFIYRYSGSPAFTPTGPPQFSDVPANHPFYKEVEWMVAEGLASGFSDGTFRPSAPITRQAQAAFFYRFAGEPTVDLPPSPSFIDVPTSHVFYEEIEWLASTGITGGFSDGTFRPAVNVSRQTSAATFFRYDAEFAATVPGAPTGVVAVAGDGEVDVSWTAPADDGGETITGYRVTTSPGGATLEVEAPATVATVTGLTNGQAYTFTVAAENARGYGPESSPSSAVTPQGVSLDAPPLDATVEPSVFDSTAFLYTGPDAVQQGVAPDTIEADRAAVIRGRVLGTDGSPVSGARVELVDAPAFGWTESRSDGFYDLVVNAGPAFLVDISRNGYLPVQRWITPAPAEWSHVDEVVLTPLDPVVTTVEAGAAEVQTVQGSEVVDEDGARQATLVVPAGTGATMELPDGSTEELETLDIRATEYTVGEDGPAAMPGELPVSSGYTYAVEFSVDEAIDADATTVEFDEPLVSYTENFIGFPVGTPVPTGWYDQEAGAWVPSDDGLVIAVVSESGGSANVDVTGDGVADGAPALAAVGIDATERETLADLYGPGAELWRVEVSHFTPWDYNWPYGCQSSCSGPNGGAPSPGGGPPPGGGPCGLGGSFVDCPGQSLSERAELVGVPFELRYESDRTSGRADGRSFDIDLTGPSLPDGLKHVELVVEVAGQRHQFEFEPAPNLETVFVWDGEDAYGRRVMADVDARVRVGFVYESVYKEPAEFSQSFGQPSTGVTLSADRSAGTITSSVEYEVTLRSTSLAGLGFGGWTVDIQHRLDPAAGQLHLGTGLTRPLPDRVVSDRVEAFAGSGTPCVGGDDPCGDGGPASTADFATDQLAWAADGSVYFHDASAHRIRRVAPDGTVHAVAGDGTDCAADATVACGTGGPATDAALRGVVLDLAVAGDGTLYLLEDSGRIIRSVESDGVIRHVAGTGSACSPGVADYPACGTGAPATAAEIGAWSIDVSTTGDLLLFELVGDRSPVIRAVGPTGVLSHLYGCADWASPSCVDAADGTLATFARIAPTIAAAGPDGSVVLVVGNTLQRIDRFGTLSTIAGGRWCAGRDSCGDGGPATAAGFGGIHSIAVDLDGSVYVLDRWSSPAAYAVRWVEPGGSVERVAGGADGCATYEPGSCGDGGAATAAAFARPGCCSPFSWSSLAVGADGRILVTDGGSIRVIAGTEGWPAGGVGVPSDDGRFVYVFSERGRHLETRDALQGFLVWSFQYDADGLLVSVTDREGDVTTIERDPTGRPTAIEGPFGQRTTVATDARGYLASLTNPAGEATTFTHDLEGLLTSLTDPEGGAHTYTYDAAGRLTSDEGPTGTKTTLNRVDIQDGWRVDTESVEGRARSYETTVGDDGSVTTTATEANGAISSNIRRADGGTTSAQADGMVGSSTTSPDPRWGTGAPFVSEVQLDLPGATPSALLTTERSVVLDPDDPLVVLAQTETSTTNGAVSTRTWDLATRTWTETSPEGRVRSLVLDELGRTITSTDPEEGVRTFEYDGHGRVSEATWGSGPTARTTTYGYDTAGRLVQQIDAAGRTWSWTYDAANRVLTSTRPGSVTTTYGYDDAGRVVTYQPPGRAAALFAYDDAGRLTSYTSPAGRVTTYAWSADGDRSQVGLPGGQAITETWDAARFLDAVDLAGDVYNHTTDLAGRPSVVTTPDGESLTSAWDASLPTSEMWTGPVSGSTGALYDADLRLISDIAAGDSRSYEYDADGRVTTAGVLELSLDPTSGLVVGTGLGSVSETLVRDQFGDVASTEATAGATDLLSFEHERDDLGRITSTTEHVLGETHTTTYEYDPTGRLTEAVRDGVVTTYTYDANGNRLTRTHDGATQTATYDADDRILTAGGATYTHTPDGRRASSTTAGATTTYDYDLYGNLLEVGLPGGTTVGYTVDGRGRRIARMVDGVVVSQYLWSGDQLTAELDGSGALRSRFVYAGDEPTPVSMIRNGTTYRILSDERGSPRLVVNTATGDVAQRLDYDEYGRVLLDTAPGFQPFGFGSGLRDPLTGLVRMGARDYDPVMGRFTTVDPLHHDASGPNLYSYVDGDPVNLTDPSGTLLPLVLGVAGAAALAGLVFGPPTACLGQSLQNRNDAINDMADDVSTGGQCGFDSANEDYRNATETSGQCAEWMQGATQAPIDPSPAGAGTWTAGQGGAAAGSY